VQASSISVGDVSVNEGNGGAVATFTITRDASLLAPAVTVAFATADASATSPADFAASSGTRDFAFSLLGGMQTQQVTVPVVGDRLDEPSESFRLVVTGKEVADGSAIATIVDDDPPPQVSVAEAAAVSEGGESSFAVGLSAPSGRAVRSVSGAPSGASMRVCVAPPSLCLTSWRPRSTARLAVARYRLPRSHATR